MKSSFPYLFLLCCALFTFSCAPEPDLAVRDLYDPSLLDGERALQEVADFLEVGPRESGSEGARRAAMYLERRLREIGLAPIVDEFTDATPAGPLVFRNVLASIGDDSGKRTVVLASHYDTKAGISECFIGANDSGSSTGLLLELARVLQHNPPRDATLLLAFFDGEECLVQYGPQDGLHGSRHLAQTLVRNRRAENVLAVIVLDMIGDRDLTVTIPRNSSRHLTALVFDAARAENARSKFGLARGNVIDDHVPFLEAGIPAVCLIDFAFGSAPGRNDYWHTPEDTLDKLSAESLQVVGRVVLRVLNTLLRNSG